MFKKYFHFFLYIFLFRTPYHPYGVPPPPPTTHFSDPYQRRPQGVGREEVLIVSDDRVLSLQPRGLLVGNSNSQSQRHMADNVSMVSIPHM